jgi:hypothetical protein
MQTTHLLSPVNHPQSNGQAERMVDTVKRAIAKDPGNWKRQLLDFLYSYRYTPCSASPEGKSPAELFFGRRMNSPFTKWIPKPAATVPASIDPSDGKRLAMEKQFARHHGVRPRDLAVGDRVIVLTGKFKREQGVIRKILSNLRYSVCLDDGRTIDRHINHISKGGSDPPTPPKSSEDDYMFLQPSTPQTSRQESPPDPKITEQPIVSLEASISTDQDPESAIIQPTPVRPARNRVAPKRLVLDPTVKSYTQQ